MGLKAEIDGSLVNHTRDNNITPENGFTSQIECELMLEEMNEKGIVGRIFALELTKPFTP